MLTISAFAMVVGCSDEQRPSPNGDAATETTTTAATVAAVNALPTRCGEPMKPMAGLHYIMFADMLRRNASLVGVRVERVSWEPDPDSTLSWQPGYIEITATVTSDGSTIDVRAPTRCEGAKAAAATLRVGAEVTILLKPASDLEIGDGHSEPIVHMAWAADDWSQPVFEPLHGMDEFERFAESRKEEPLDTVRALLVSPNEVYSEFADFDQG